MIRTIDDDVLNLRVNDVSTDNINGIDNVAHYMFLPDEADLTVTIEAMPNP